MEVRGAGDDGLGEALKRVFWARTAGQSSDAEHAQSKGGHVSEESRRPAVAESEEWAWLVR